MGKLIKYTIILTTMSMIMGGCTSSTTKKQAVSEVSDFVLSNMKYEVKESGKTITYNDEDVSYDFKNKIIYCGGLNELTFTNTQLPVYYGLDFGERDDTPKMDFNYLSSESINFMKNFDYIIIKSGCHKIDRKDDGITFTRFLGNSIADDSQRLKFNKSGLLVNANRGTEKQKDWERIFNYQNKLISEVKYTNYEDNVTYSIKYKYNKSNQITSYDEFENSKRKGSASYTYENDEIKEIAGTHDGNNFKITLEYDDNGCLIKQKYKSGIYEYDYEYNYDTINNVKKKNKNLSYEIRQYNIADSIKKEIEKKAKEEKEAAEESEYPTIKRSELEKNSDKYIGRKISFEGYYIAEGDNKILLSSTYRKTRLLNLTSEKTKELNEAVLGIYTSNSKAKEDYNTIFEPGYEGDISSFYLTYVKIKGVYKGFKSDNQELKSGMVHFDNDGQSIPIIEVESIEEL